MGDLFKVCIVAEAIGVAMVSPVFIVLMAMHTVAFLFFTYQTP